MKDVTSNFSIFSVSVRSEIQEVIPETTQQCDMRLTGDTEEGEKPSDEIAVGRPSFWSIVGVGWALERFFWQLHKSLVRCLLNNLGQNCMRRCKDSILFGEYLVKAACTLSTWDWPLWKKGWNDVLKKSNLLKRETIRTTGGRMIILDMIPTLISYNNEFFDLEIWEIESILYTLIENIEYVHLNIF